MFWRKTLVLAVIVSMAALFGCATAPQKTGGTALEEFEETPAKEIVYSQEREKPYSEEQAKETRFTALKEKIKEHLPVKKALEKAAAEKSRPQHVASAKDIQTALKNAGYYTGNIDGKVGPLTDSAIKAFQKDNAIKVDGIVGQRTWNLLSKYLVSPAPSQPLVAPLPLLSTETTVTTLAEAPVTLSEVAPIAEEGLPMLEEVPAPSRNFTPLIIIIIIILMIIMGLSIYRRRSA